MPGIAGIVDLKGRDLTGWLAKMLACLKSEPWHKTDSFSQADVALGRVSLGVSNLESKPVFATDGSLGLIFHGEVYHFPEEFSDVVEPKSNRKSANEANLVLRLIQQRGREAISRLNGAFVLALWDTKERALTIANDQFGLKPLYYFFSSNNLFAFSSEVKSILTLPETGKEVDPQAVAEFLTFECLLGNRTFFKSIKVLEPASILTLKSGNLSIKKYYEPGCPKEETSFWKEGPLEGAKHLLGQAVERQIGEGKGVALSLSGGLDSRLILAAAAEIGFPVPTFTFGVKDCDDARIAQQVARCLGSGNLFFELSADYLSNWAEKGVWRTDGMNNCINFAGIEIQAEVGKNWEIVLNGSGGNELWGGISPGLLKFLFLRNKGILTRAFFKKMSTGFPEDIHSKLFQSSYHAQISGAAYQSFAESLNQSPDQSCLGKVYYFYRYEKTRRGTLMGLVLDSDQVVYRLPFFDYDLFNFILSIPHRLRVFAGFKRRLLVEKFPQAATIPYQRTGLPVKTGLFPIALRLAWNRYHGLFKKQARVNVRSCVDNDHWLRNELKEFVTSILLSKKALEREYFRAECIKELVHLHLSGKRNLSSKLGVLLTFELWNQLFIDGKVRS